VEDLDHDSSGVREGGLCVISLVSLLQLGGGIAVAKVFFNITLQSEVFILTKAIEIWLIAGMVADILIAITMTYILQSAKARSHFTQTRDLLDRLARQTIQTGAATAVLALTIFLVFILVREGTLHTGFADILGKFYIISLLANLNARCRSTTGATPSESFSAPSQSVNLRLARRLSASGIRVDTQRETTGDDFQTVSVYGSNGDKEHFAPRFNNEYPLKRMGA